MDNPTSYHIKELCPNRKEGGHLINGNKANNPNGAKEK